MNLIEKIKGLFKKEKEQCCCKQTHKQEEDFVKFDLEALKKEFKCECDKGGDKCECECKCGRH